MTGRTGSQEATFDGRSHLPAVWSDQGCAESRTHDDNMTSKPVLREASTKNEFAAARLLFEEYAEHLAIDLCFQDFESELRQLPDMYGPPSGCLLLACRDEAFVGCG